MTAKAEVGDIGLVQHSGHRVDERERNDLIAGFKAGDSGLPRGLDDHQIRLRRQAAIKAVTAAAAAIAGGDAGHMAAVTGVIVMTGVAVALQRLVDLRLGDDAAAVIGACQA